MIILNMTGNSAAVYLFKVNNKTLEQCMKYVRNKLTIKTPQRPEQHH